MTGELNYTGRSVLRCALGMLLVGASLTSAAAADPKISELSVSPLSAERTNTIMTALVQKKWDLKPILEQKYQKAELSAADAEQIRLWQGNTPRFDMGFSDFSLKLQEGTGKESKTTQFYLDIFGRFLRARYSESRLPKYVGGVVFDDIYSSNVGRIFVLGTGNRGMMLFVPPLVKGDDFYMMACPRELKPRAATRMALHNYDWKPESMLFHVFGHSKARLLSGNSYGTIENKIEQSSGIPQARESMDSARGRNPQVELIYRALPEYPLQPFPESGERTERFVMSVDMRLPAGYRRKMTEGFNFWVKKVTLPETEVAVPLGTIGLTNTFSGLSREVRRLDPRAGVATTMEAGPCMLLVGERSEPERFLTREEAPAQESEE